jgi:hypothetical protein
MTPNAVHGACFRLGISLRGGKTGNPMSARSRHRPPRPAPHPSDDSDRTDLENELITRCRMRRAARTGKLPRCVWSGCAEDIVPGKAYCRAHAERVRGGVVSEGAGR